MGMLAFAIAILLCTARWAHGVAVEPADTDAARAWVADVIEKSATGPFSFTYGGKPASELTPTWTVTREHSGSANSSFKCVWTCPATGLQVRVEGTAYGDFPVVEWVVYLKNTGSADTPLLEDIQALDIVVPTSDGDPTLHYAKGATCSIEDYRPMRRILNKGGHTHLQPGGAGRRVIFYRSSIWRRLLSTE
jgi:hypothetical protein